MTELEIHSAEGAAGDAAAPKRRRAAPRRKTAARPRAAASKSAPRKKAAPRAGRKTARRGTPDLPGLLRSFAKKAAGAGSRLASFSGEGAEATRRALGRVSGASRRTIDRLVQEWKEMDAAKKARVLAALLGALAAASAPIVRRRLKRK